MNLTKKQLSELMPMHSLPVKKREKSTTTESKVQSKVSKWLRHNHPLLYFQTDFAAGLHLPINIATIRASQAPDMKVLDITILKARKPYHGLVIELKKDGESPFLKDGITLKSNNHLRSQNQSIEILRGDGYYATFSVGFDETILVIERYLSLPIW